MLLIFPNVYSVGISNLGFQTVYRILNEMKGVSCDLLYLPDDEDIKDCESGFELPSFYLERTPLEFDMILFSISFENDLLNIFKLLRYMGIPLISEDRDESFPVLGAGGIVPSSNPEPFAPFFDFFVLGDAEGVMEKIIDVFLSSDSKRDFIENLAPFDFVYVPAFYSVRREGLFYIPFPSKKGTSYPLLRNLNKDFINKGNISCIVSPFSVFGKADIVEVSRGCPKRCFFCLSSFVYRPVRFVKNSVIEDMVSKSPYKKIGFLGTSVSEHRGLVSIIKAFSGEKVFTFSSIRIDAHETFIEAIKDSGSKSITFGIEAPSFSLRKKIGKLIPDNLIFERLSYVSAFFDTVKLYFMIGLPGERDEDIEAFEDFLKNVSGVMKANLTLSISPFVPKPFTPFEREGFCGLSTIKRRLKRLKVIVSKFKRVRITYDLPKWAKLQALISRGDRRVGLYLAGYTKDLKQEIFLSPIPSAEALPWRIIDTHFP